MALMTASGGLSNGKLALATAGTGDVLAGKTYYAGDKEIKTGSMVNNGAWDVTVEPYASVTIPRGYHNGSGSISGGTSRIRQRPVAVTVGGTSTISNISEVYDSTYMSSSTKFAKACRARVRAIARAGGDHTSCTISCNGQTIAYTSAGNNPGSTGSGNVTLDVPAGAIISASRGGNYNAYWTIIVFVEE